MITFSKILITQILWIWSWHKNHKIIIVNLKILDIVYPLSFTCNRLHTFDPVQVHKCIRITLALWLVMLSWGMRKIGQQSCTNSWKLSVISLAVVTITHWGWVTHICIGNLTIIGSDNGFWPGRRQAITWTNVGILLIRPLGTNFSEMSIEIHTFSFK